MSEIKRIKINHILDSQIPEFLNEESPLFQEFLTQYYISQEHQTGVVDLATNIQKYKSIQNFNKETLIDIQLPSVLLSNILSFDDVISASHTIGYPDTYGLIKIDDEIITYTSKTSNSFLGCIRGFSGIDSLEKDNNSEFLNFSVTEASDHIQGSTLNNLSYIFFFEFFKKFKYQFLPGFEERNFTTGISLTNILSRAKDFYKAKGTDQSFKLLFSALYGKEVEVLKPQNYMLRPSDNNYLTTKNILVEKVFGGDPILLKGSTLNQYVSGVGTVSASIYNVEYRPIENKDLYEISLDSTSFTGSFETTGTTKVLEPTDSSASSITVDSTVGFAYSGALIARKTDLTTLNLRYTDKTNNQLLNISGLSTDLNFGNLIYEDKLAYSYISTESSSLVQFRVINVIDNIDFQNSSGLKKGDKISLSSFGVNLADNVNFNKWIYNIPTYHNIIGISTISSNTYRIVLKDNIKFYKNDKIYIADSTDISATITEIESDNQIIANSDISINTSNVIRIKKQISKANSDYFDSASSINGVIQNTYIDKDEKYSYVASSGFPNYEFTSTDTKIIVSTVGTGQTSTLFAPNHNLLTGEKVYYNSSSFSGITTGYYFARKIDENYLSLSYSNTDLFVNKYISLNSGITSDYIYKFGYENKTIKNQKFLRKFNLQENINYFDKKEDRTTFNRRIGLLINGVDLYSPTLFDENIYYGKLDSILITNKGSNYDVINSPEIVIADTSGNGAKARLILSGSLKEVKINSPGIGYDRKPKITLIGGNGSGAILESNLVRSRIIAKFRADLTAINTALETITFIDNHNFDNYEEVTYYTNGNSIVPGLIDNANYFTNVINSKTIKLHKNRVDVLSGINTVNITGISSGFHEFRTLKSKNTITKVYVKNEGSNYSNRFVNVSSNLYPSLEYQTSGISTFDDYIYAKQHGFKNGDVILYSNTNTSISGLSTNIQYCITTIDENKFKLSDVGIGTTSSNSNYINKKYINLESLGIGTHTFAYPPIQIQIETTSAIGSSSIVSPVLTPVVLGSAENVYIEDGGVSYGCSDILNYHRRPYVELSSISSALLKPVIINGSITDVQIIYGGFGYDNGTKIEIYGDGKYADLKPIITNGSITSFIVVDSGVGYSSSNTTLNAIRRGKDLQFIANVFEWKINQIEKNKNLISYYAGDDETITYPNIDQNLELGVINFYLPRQLRKNINDNIQDNNQEILNDFKHSPIIGWAYDGNPIYGPYGYTSLADKTVKLIPTSYNKKSISSSLLRPSSFVNGFFVQDYQYDASEDLDEYNGRFCITPEYPYGTYAYFATYDLISGQLYPKYPYIISDYFKDTPIFENFDPSFTQDVNISKYNLTRNIGNYFLDSINSGYEILEKTSPFLKQEFYVNQIKKSGISSIFIDSPGDGYNVGDLINFNKAQEGTGISAEISRLKGKPISNMVVGISTFSDVVFSSRGNIIIGITSYSHSLLNGDKVVISGVSTVSLSQLEGTKTIFVNQKTTGLTTSLQNSSTTGLSTSIKVTDTFGFEINDSIGIGTETMTITGIVPETSQLLVNRSASGGIHTAGIENVILLSNKFQFAEIDSIPVALPENKMIYFDPTNTIGFGLSGTNYSVVGIGTSTIVNRFVPTKLIYIPNHKFYTGQQLIYNYSAGIGLSVYDSPSNVFSLVQNQTIYAVNYGNDYLGISTIGFTSSVGIGTTLNSLLFAYNSTVGYSHSIRSTYQTVTARVENYSGIVTTSQNHNLLDGDKIKFTIIPSRSENISFRFDAKNRKITTNLIGFSASSVSFGNTSTINLGTNNLKSGDKVIYYSGTSPIGGLVDNSTYYILKQNPNKIQLCQYAYDVKVGVALTFTNSGVGTHNVALINPPLSFSKGNQIIFDISDSSLTDTKLEFYTDPTFKKKFEIDKKEINNFAITRSNSLVIIETNNRNIPPVLYYNFTATSLTDPEKLQLSSDNEVIGHNKIDIRSSILSSEQSIIGIGVSVFKFNLDQKPEYTAYTQVLGISSVFYDTDSKNTSGPISQIRVNSYGKSYGILPPISSIGSTSGSSAILYPISFEIGKVLSFDRVKDGFDYPTDPTMLPQLSVPAVCIIKEISRVNSVGILTGGKKYNTPPRLKVIGNDELKLTAGIQGGSVNTVSVDTNSFNLKDPLRIVPYNNSNGYEIDNIYTNNLTGLGTIELVNDPTQFPYISTGYGSSISIFPFEVGDQIFIEKCRLSVGTASSSNYNSRNYGYNFFTVTAINTTNKTLDYSMVGLQTGKFGTYNQDLTLGYVVNRKDMPEFEMKLIDDAEYFSGEKVSSTNFSAKVMENGWNNDINQLRLIDVKGTLNPGDRLYGEISKLNGVVKFVSQFNLPASIGVTRDKIHNLNDNIGYLNDYQQRLSDNNYYQKFSYSIKGEIPYLTWRESVKSIIHPSGFKEFSDLNIIGVATTEPVNLGIAKSTNMKVNISSSEPSLLVEIDNTSSLYTKNNFSMVYEDDMLDDGSVERVYFPQGTALKSYILNKTNKVLLIDDISSQFTGITSTIGGSVVGLSSFKLTSSSYPLFYKEFVGSATTVIDLVNDKFVIPNHGFQSGQQIVYNSGVGSTIGIATTSYAQGPLDVIMAVGAGIGSAIYENGYNKYVPYSGITTGISTTLVPAGPSIQYFGFGSPIPSTVNTGIGTGALFQVLINYNAGTGIPIGTSIQLIDGGRGYSVGQQISIAGTYFGGSTPTNNLYFTVSKVSSTRTGTANASYISVASSSSGTGTGAIFDVYRDLNKDISLVNVIKGGVGYASTDQIIISGGDIGGSAPADNLYLSPTVLGTKKLPTNLFVRKIDVNNFQLSGLSTTISSPFNLISLGSGTQSFSLQESNQNVIISIDNIIQSAIHRKNITIGLSSSVGIASTSIYVSSGINSITASDILKIDNEYLKINSIGIGSTNSINVSRSFMGSVATAHTIGAAVTVYTGDFNIVRDSIYFSTPPYGPAIASTDPQFATSSSFNGRVFSRAYDSSQPNDVNLILDDISTDFTGVAATQFTLKSNENSVVGLYTNTNDSTDINNNPIILINNVFQVPGIDYSIDTPGTNTIKFLSGVPNGGKIVNVAITTGYGYQPLLGASATASVSVGGTINAIILNGAGSGYRTSPSINIASTVGSGASITSTIGVGGTISNVSITNGGIGYTSTSPIYVNIDLPLGYSNLGIAYTNGSIGSGINAKVSVQVGSGSSIIQFNLDDPGTAYKVGDVLKVVGLTTNPNAGALFEEFKITVTEVLNDKFSGFYPGQFIFFDDFSQYFNDSRKKFTLTQTKLDGTIEVVDLKKLPGSDLDLRNNLFVYLNDILQEPNYSYTFIGTRIVFNEAPKANSKCSVIFYRGSSLDVQTITPPKTIKEGDVIVIGENIYDNLDREQFERVVKQIVSSDQLDTYNYDSIGINTDPDKSRPLKWTKQTQDRIIKGSLVSKARPSLISTIRPTTRIINQVNSTDTSIYVNNAYPLFTDVDNLTESDRNILIIENKDTTTSISTAVVSVSSTISSIVISDGGIGYASTTSPKVSISTVSVQSKDPILNWTISSGLSTSASLLSVVVSNPIVAVGSFGVVAITTDAESLQSLTNIGYAKTITFNSIGVGSTNKYIAVGQGGKIVSAVGFGTTISSWTEIGKYEETSVFGIITRSASSYISSLSDIKYSTTLDKWFSVGYSGAIFSAVGVGSTSFVKIPSNTSENLNSIAFGNIIVAIGDNGTIITSGIGTFWSSNNITAQHLNKIIWTGTKFVVVGNNSTILISYDGNSWTAVTPNIVGSFVNIHYNSSYDLYTLLNSSGILYYSKDLQNLTQRSSNQSNILKYIDYSPNLDRYISVGIGATMIYCDPVYNFAAATSNTTSGIITSITITNPGFGYNLNNAPKVLIEPEKTKIEEVVSIKAKGDFGIIVGIDTSVGTGSTIPKIKFKLKSENYDNNTLGVGYSSLNTYGIVSSQISIGDYFTIYNSNVQCGHALTGITTSSIPWVVVGTANTFIDGVYRAENVESSGVGIVTVTCSFNPGSGLVNSINFATNTQLITNGFYGNYSWGKIYDYQNRALGSPKQFTLNTNNGLIGLSTSPEVTRTRGLFKSK